MRKNMALFAYYCWLNRREEVTEMIIILDEWNKKIFLFQVIIFCQLCRGEKFNKFFIIFSRSAFLIIKHLFPHSSVSNLANRIDCAGIIEIILRKEDIVGTFLETYYLHNDCKVC